MTNKKQKLNKPIIVLVNDEFELMMIEALKAKINKK